MVTRLVMIAHQAYPFNRLTDDMRWDFRHLPRQGLPLQIDLRWYGPEWFNYLASLNFRYDHRAFNQLTGSPKSGRK